MNQNNISTLIEKLKYDPSIAKRREAATALGNMQTNTSISDSIPALIAALGDYETIAIFATLSLVKIGSPAIPYLIEGLHSVNEEIRGYCAEILGELQVTEAQDILMELVKNDKSKWVINNAIEALGRIKTPQVESFLRKLINHPDVETAVNAALALKNISDNSDIGLQLLDRLIETKNSYREMLAWAIIELCSREEIPELAQRRDHLSDPDLDQIMSQIIQGISLK